MKRFTRKSRSVPPDEHKLLPIRQQFCHSLLLFELPIVPWISHLHNIVPAEFFFKLSSFLERKLLDLPLCRGVLYCVSFDIIYFVWLLGSVSFSKKHSIWLFVKALRTLYCWILFVLPCCLHCITLCYFFEGNSRFNCLLRCFTLCLGCLLKYFILYIIEYYWTLLCIIKC